MQLNICFPHGAGGMWLKGVLYQCMTGEIAKKQSVNFHNNNANRAMDLVFANHDIEPTDNAISIDNKNAHFNFTRYYAYKRLLNDKNNKVAYTRHRNFRIPTDPYASTTDKLSSFFWTVNQVKFIDSYKWKGRFEIDWLDIVKNPSNVWQTINKFLSANNWTNVCKEEDFLAHCKNYIQTINNINLVPRWHSTFFQLYGLAVLQNKNIEFPFNVFDTFYSTHWFEYMEEYKQMLLEYAQSNTSELVEDRFLTVNLKA